MQVRRLRLKAITMAFCGVLSSTALADEPPPPPVVNGYTTSAHRQRGVVAAPKMFAFDTIFSQDDSLVSISR